MPTAKRMLNTFAYILAGYTLNCAIFITIFVPELEFHISLLWQAIALSAVCTLGNFIYYCKSILNKKQMRVRIIFHFLYINAVVVGGAILFDWITPGLNLQLLVLLLLIVALYAIITVVSFRQEKKIAEDLNRQLRKQFPEQEDRDER